MSLLLERKLIEEEKKLAKLLEEICEKNDINFELTNHSNKIVGNKAPSTPSQNSSPIKTTNHSRTPRKTLSYHDKVADVKQEPVHKELDHNSMQSLMNQNILDISTILKEKDVVIDHMKLKMVELENTIVELVKYKNSVTGISLLLSKSIDKAFTPKPVDHADTHNNNKHTAVLNKDRDFMLKMHHMLQTNIHKTVTMPDHMHSALATDPNNTTDFRSSESINHSNIHKTESEDSDIPLSLTDIPKQVAITRNLTILSLGVEETLAQLFDILARKQLQLVYQAKSNQQSSTSAIFSTMSPKASSKQPLNSGIQSPAAASMSTTATSAPVSVQSEGLWIDSRVFLLFCMLAGVFADDKLTLMAATAIFHSSATAVLMVKGKTDEFTKKTTLDQFDYRLGYNGFVNALLSIQRLKHQGGAEDLALHKEAAKETGKIDAERNSNDSQQQQTNKSVTFDSAAAIESVYEQTKRSEQPLSTSNAPTTATATATATASHSAVPAPSESISNSVTTPTLASTVMAAVNAATPTSTTENAAVTAEKPKPRFMLINNVQVPVREKLYTKLLAASASQPSMTIPSPAPVPAVPKPIFTADVGVNTDPLPEPTATVSAANSITTISKTITNEDGTYSTVALDQSDSQNSNRNTANEVKVLGLNNIHNTLLTEWTEKVLKSLLMKLCDTSDTLKVWSDMFLPMLSNDPLWELLVSHQATLYTAFKRGKSYGCIPKHNTTKKSHSNGMGVASPTKLTAVEAGVKAVTQHSAFEIFCLNYDIIPHLTTVAVVRRIAQFVRRVTAEDNLEYFLACLYFLSLYLTSCELEHQIDEAEETRLMTSKSMHVRAAAAEGRRTIEAAQSVAMVRCIERIIYEVQGTI